jgi:hypothetical protein
VHTEGPRFIRSGRDDAPPARVAAYDHGPARERRIARLLHRHEEGIQVYVQDLPRHRGSLLARVF